MLTEVEIIVKGVEAGVQCSLPIIHETILHKFFRIIVRLIFLSSSITVYIFKMLFVK